MAKLLKGLPVAKALTEELKAQVEELHEEGVVPTIAIVRVGERDDREGRREREEARELARQAAHGADDHRDDEHDGADGVHPAGGREGGGGGEEAIHNAEC